MGQKELLKLSLSIKQSMKRIEQLVQSHRPPRTEMRIEIKAEPLSCL
jgi:hypothetical protein